MIDTPKIINLDDALDWAFEQACKSYRDQAERSDYHPRSQDELLESILQKESET